MTFCIKSERLVVMISRKLFIIFLLNILALIFYIILFSFFYTRQLWIYWIFVIINFILSLFLLKIINHKIIWNKKIIIFQMLLAIIFICIFFLPADKCGTVTKSSTITSCDCLGIMKNTSLFSTGCIGKRIKCYKHLPYGGGVDKVISNCEEGKSILFKLQ